MQQVSRDSWHHLIIKVFGQLLPLQGPLGKRILLQGCLWYKLTLEMPCLLKTQGPSFSTTLPPVPCSMQSSEKMLSEGRCLETTRGWGHFRRCPIFLTRFHDVSASCFTSMWLTPCDQTVACTWSVSASSKCWFTNSHHGLSAHPYITHLFNRLLSTLPACHGGSASADPSAFLASQFPTEELRPNSSFVHH